MDTNEINIGKHALIGPKSGLYGAIHPFDVEARNEGIEKQRQLISVMVLGLVVKSNNSARCKHWQTFSDWCWFSGNKRYTR